MGRYTKDKRYVAGLSDDYSLKEWCSTIKGAILYEAKQRGIDLKGPKEIYLDMLRAYDEEMEFLSTKPFPFSYFAPGRFEHAGSLSFTFYYKGAEVICIVRCNKDRKERHVSFVDTKYGYCFNDFYDYVKYRYAKEDLAK